MAAKRTKLQKISAVTGTAVVLLGVAGLNVSVGHVACPFTGLFEISLRASVGALLSVIFAAWQLLVPSLMGHARLLDCLLQVTTCGWRIFLAFTGVA